MKKNFLDSISGAAMKLSLRRTLVRSVRSSAKPTRGRSQYNHLLSSALQGGDVLQSTTNEVMFIPSLEGRQQLPIKKSLKGVGLILLLSLFFPFNLLAQRHMNLVSRRFLNCIQFSIKR